MHNVELWLASPHRWPAHIPATLRDSVECSKARQAYAAAVAQEPDGSDPAARKRYQVASGAALIPILGPMVKDPALAWWLGGTSTETARAAVMEAAADDDVLGIFMRVYSGGGEVDGTEELATAVARAAKVKPVYAHIDDLGASAAYWVASQATQITANATADVGSIGVVAQLADTEEAWKQIGVTWHTVSTGEYKGLLSEPAVSEEALAYVADLLAPLFDAFLGAVAKGRGLGIGDVRAAADGRVYTAKVAQGLGLIDGIMAQYDAERNLSKAIVQADRERRAAALDRTRADEVGRLMAEAEASRERARGLEAQAKAAHEQAEALERAARTRERVFQARP